MFNYYLFQAREIKSVFMICETNNSNTTAKIFFIFVILLFSNKLNNFCKPCVVMGTD